jgi:hypothetical protein
MPCYMLHIPYMKRVSESVCLSACVRVRERERERESEREREREYLKIIVYG